MTDENFIIDPSSVSVQTIVPRLIENAAHAAADLDEVAEYVKNSAKEENADSSALDSVEQWLGFAMNEVENIGLLAEALAKRLGPVPDDGGKTDDGEENDSDFYSQLTDLKHGSVEQLVVAISVAISGICKDNDYATDAREFLDELSDRLFHKSTNDLYKSNSEWAAKVNEMEKDNYLTL